MLLFLKFASSSGIPLHHAQTHAQTCYPSMSHYCITMPVSLSSALQILGLQSGASLHDINKAFRHLALKVHPDKNKAPDAKEQAQALTEAREIAALHCHQAEIRAQERAAAAEQAKAAAKARHDAKAAAKAKAERDRAAAKAEAAAEKAKAAAEKAKAAAAEKAKAAAEKAKAAAEKATDVEMMRAARPTTAHGKASSNAMNAGMKTKGTNPICKRSRAAPVTSGRTTTVLHHHRQASNIEPEEVWLWKPENVARWNTEDPEAFMESGNCDWQARFRRMLYNRMLLRAEWEASTTGQSICPRVLHSPHIMTMALKAPLLLHSSIYFLFCDSVLCLSVSEEHKEN